jgi:hypothetical protein
MTRAPAARERELTPIDYVLLATLDEEGGFTTTQVSRLAKTRYCEGNPHARSAGIDRGF